MTSNVWAPRRVSKSCSSFGATPASKQSPLSALKVKREQDSVAKHRAAHRINVDVESRLITAESIIALFWAMILYWFDLWRASNKIG